LRLKFGDSAAQVADQHRVAAPGEIVMRGGVAKMAPDCAIQRMSTWRRSIWSWQIAPARNGGCSQARLINAP